MWRLARGQQPFHDITDHHDGWAGNLVRGHRVA